MYNCNCYCKWCFPKKWCHVVQHSPQQELCQRAAYYKLFKDSLKSSQKFPFPLLGSFFPSHGWEYYSESACGEGVLIFSGTKLLREVLCVEVRSCSTQQKSKTAWGILNFMSCSLWEQSELPFRAAFDTKMKPSGPPCMVLHIVCLSEERWIS